MDYKNKLILAPMVRIGTLPMRLLALDYGADIVYCEELIDWKLLRSVRRENDVLGTVDYLDKTDGTVVFRTTSREKDKVVLQLGSCNADRAVTVARMLEKDVAAIDLNMGCPKKFSVDGGMGAALLSQPEKALDILRSLTKAVNIPVTCKIRVLPSLDETIELCKILESSGISAIAVHGRTKEERQQHPNRNHVIQAISKSLNIPVIANGGSREIECYEDIAKFREVTGCSCVMLARAAEWNCSVFRAEGKLLLDDVIKSYLKYAVDYDNAPANTKYCVQNMLRELQETPRGKKFLEAQTLEQICSLWDMGEYCRAKQSKYKELGLYTRRDVIPGSLEPSLKKRKVEAEDTDVFELQCAFYRSVYLSDVDLPKTKLLVYAKKNGLGQPKYDTRQEDKLFKSVVTVNHKKYSSSYWEKNKRWAEQGAALVCLCALGIVSKEELMRNGSIG